MTSMEQQNLHGEADSPTVSLRTTATLLVDNHVEQRGLLAEHGLAWLIRRGERSVLFDTGQGLALQHNAEHLGVNLRALDAVALSHGHYDHTGALRPVLDMASGAALYAHPAAFESKFAKRSLDKVVEIGMPAFTVLRLHTSSRFRATTGPTEVLPGLWATGQIPRGEGFHTSEGYFFLDPSALRPDPLVDDQAMFFDSNEGLIVILGCAHAGVVSTLRYVRALRPGRPIHAVLGGMHMLRADASQRRSTLEALVELQVERVVPAHCTGVRFVADLIGAYGTHCVYPSVGDCWAFESSTSRAGCCQTHREQHGEAGVGC